MNNPRNIALFADSVMYHFIHTDNTFIRWTNTQRYHRIELYYMETSNFIF